MAKEKAEVASLNPDDFMSAGLKSDFRARITEAVYCHWDYRGSLPEPVLGVRLKMDMLDDDGDPIEDDGGSEYTDTWSAGSLDAFVPSEDGRTAAEGDEDEGGPVGPYALKVGKRPQMNNNTGFAHLMQTIIAAGEASGHFTRENLTPSLECLVGLDAQWGRVPKKKRPGLDDKDAKKDGDKKRSDDILVVTEVFGYGAKSKKGAKAAPAKTATKAKEKAEPEDDEDEDEKDPIDAKLEKIVSGALEDAGGTLKRGKLANIVIKAAAKDKDKAKMVKRVGEDDFLNSGPWTYDEDEGTLTSEE